MRANSGRRQAGWQAVQQRRHLAAAKKSERTVQRGMAHRLLERHELALDAG